MEPTIQKVLEQNEEVKWEGRQDAMTMVIASLVGIIALIAVGIIFYLVGSNTAGTCVVNGVPAPVEQCNGIARKAAYAAFIIAALTPIFAYWRYRVTHYLITNKRLLIKSGLIGADVNSIYYDRVHAVSVDVGIIGKIFGTGNIIIDTGKAAVVHGKNGDSTQTLYDRFAGIKNPYEVYKMVQEILNANKGALYGGKGM